VANCGLTENDTLKPIGFSGKCGPSKITFTFRYPWNGQHPTSSHECEGWILLTTVLKIQAQIFSETWTTEPLQLENNTSHCPLLTYFSPIETTWTQLLRASLNKTQRKTAVNTEPTAKFYHSKFDELSSVCLFSLYKEMSVNGTCLLTMYSLY